MNLQNREAAEVPLARVLYCSQATGEMSKAQVQKIIKTSRSNNSRRGITGAMVYGGGMFIQWLEGPRHEVRKLVATIEMDPRHEVVGYLHKRVGLRKRCYPSSAMHSVAPDEIADGFANCMSLIHDADEQQVIIRMITLLETCEYEASGGKSAVRPPTHAVRDTDGLISLAKNWFLGSAKNFEDSRWLSFLDNVSDHVSSVLSAPPPPPSHYLGRLIASMTAPAPLAFKPMRSNPAN